VVEDQHSTGKPAVTAALGCVAQSASSWLTAPAGTRDGFLEAEEE